jgi:Nucleosome-binding factor SPN, POB3 subunit
MFDLTVSLKDGQFSNFSGIDKKELELIMEYFQARKIPVRTMTDASNLIIDDDDESDDVIFFSLFFFYENRTIEMRMKMMKLTKKMKIS